MAHKKAGGSTKNGRDSNPKYLGIKISHGNKAKLGAILVRQRGTIILPGKNTSLGNDHTIFATKEGIVVISGKRKTHFDRNVIPKKVISVV